MTIRIRPGYVRSRDPASRDGLFSLAASLRVARSPPVVAVLGVVRSKDPELGSNISQSHGCEFEMVHEREVGTASAAASQLLPEQQRS